MHKVELALAALPEDQTTVTYPDSFVAMEVGSIPDRRPYHGKVFLLAELPELVETHGHPSPSWDSEDREWTSWPQETFIEVQLWVDDPVQQYLSP